MACHRRPIDVSPSWSWFVIYRQCLRQKVCVLKEAHLFITETSAHSLCFSVLLLALYPDVQQKVYEEVLRLWPDGAPTAETTIAAVCLPFSAPNIV